MCDNYTSSTIWEAWVDGAYFDAVICPYDFQMGALVFGLFIYGSVATALYVRTQNIALVLGVSILTGTVAIARLPSGAMQILGFAILMGLSVAAMLVYIRIQNIT